jgi:hypothetical protein
VKSRIQFLLAIPLLTFLVVCPLQAQDAQYRTTTLLPVIEEVRDAQNNRQDAPDSYLWIQRQPEIVIFLQFDLHGLPDGLTQADFKKCFLRLVAEDPRYQPEDNKDNTGGGIVTVRGRSAADDLSSWDKNRVIVSLSDIRSTDNANVAIGQSAQLINAIGKQYRGDKVITLRLETISDKAGALFYSSENSRSPRNPSNIPRLVIEYSMGPPRLLETLSWSQHQQNPEHTGRSPWIPFRNPTGFGLTEIGLPRINGQGGSVQDYPLIFKGNMYLVLKVLDLNYLLALDFQGRELWRHEIGSGTIQRPPVISRDGIFYAVTESEVSAYDLNHSGQSMASCPLSGKLSDYTDLTCGSDGSLFAALKENGLNYIYGFTADLKPFIKSGPFGDEEGKISTVTISPAGREIFAQIPRGAVVIDISDPARQEIIELAHADEKPWKYYHVPLAGPAGGVMVFSDFSETANKGNIWGYAADQRIWSASGTLIPQPVLGSNDLVYFIQGGSLQGHHYDQHGSAAITSGTDLNATSNLVMDGADNVYFWDNGFLHGHRADGEPLFAKIPMTTGVRARNVDEYGRQVAGPEQFIRFWLGPDGTLWANNKNGNALFAFKPQYAEPDLVLRQEDLKSNTVYRAAGVIAMAEGGLTLEADKNIMLQAGRGITLPKGFAVKKGAGLICRTGF